ncbi:DNA repair protein XRCC2 homolog [Hibiscus syriacus]|uniref:DNA repair protein XRCC2 homolog n=1 Tax=Hibiscus syriacus TaxID=106335 RepID=UPI001922E0F9|nr:DNA repair protein XRCC2 homolog [Hibiscus syriacus]
MLVMATKAVVLGNKYSTNELTRNYGKWNVVDNPYSRNVTSSDRQLPYRENMPSVWQSFVTHRILVQATDDDLVNDEHRKGFVYLLEWLMPPVNSLDKFTVTGTVVFILS